MNPRELGRHTLQRFDEELDDLRRKVLNAGGLVESQVADAVEAMITSDSTLVERVLTTEDEVNRLELAIDQDALDILARRAPVAGDLRLVFTIIKAITDLERMGDESVRIARVARRQASHGSSLQLLGQLRRLAEQVREMLGNALDAFARVDVELAAQVIETDRSVDREYDALSRELLTYMMDDSRAISACLDVQWAARALERIGDRSCNLAEYVIYLGGGADVRHPHLNPQSEEE